MCIRDRFFCEVFRYNNVVIGYDSFDSGDDKLIFYLGFQFFQMRLQIRDVYKRQLKDCQFDKVNALKHFKITMS